MLRPCLGLPGEPCTALGDGSRCLEHERRWKQLRDSDRETAKTIVAASPVCAVCGATEDLTAGHVVRLIEGGRHDGPRQTECRSCNSKANRGRSNLIDPRTGKSPFA